MSDVPQTQDRPSPPPLPVASDSPRWSWPRVLLSGPLRPARTAEASDHLPFWKLLLIHVAALFLIWPLAEFDNWLTSPSPSRLLIRQAIEDLPKLLASGDLPPEALLAMLVVFGLIEILVLSAGSLVSPWGARDESLKTSIWRGLRRGLAVSGIWPAAFLLMTLAESLGREYIRGVQSDYWTVVAAMLVPVWQYWAILRAVGAGRPGFASPPPPTCFQCGYDLSGTDPEGICPECAVPVIQSTAPGERPGTPWEHRRIRPAVEAYAATTGQALGRPWLLGRRMRLSSEDRHHRRFLLVNLVLATAVFWVMLNLFSQSGHLSRDPQGSVLQYLGTGVSVATTALSLVLLVVGLVGAWLTLRTGRPLMQTAMRAASYAGFLVVVWAALVGVQVWTATDAFGWAWQMGPRNGVIVLTALYVLPHLLWFIWYCLLTWRITLGAQYATR